MKLNLFLFLLKQCTIRALQGALGASLIFLPIGLGALLLVDEFPPIPEILLSWQGIMFSLFAMALFVAFIIAGGIVLAAWLFWCLRNGEFLQSNVISIGAVTSMATWLGFSSLVILPETQYLWGDYFNTHEALTLFLDSLGLFLGVASGIWAGWRLFGVLQGQNALNPQWFVFEWKIQDWRTHLQLLWKGGSLGLVCAFVASAFFALLWVFIPVLLNLLSGEINSLMLKDALPIALVMWGIVSGFTAIPAIIGGYAIAYLFYVDKLNATFTKENAFWQASIVAGLAAFAVSSIVSGTFPHGSLLLEVTPIVLGLTFLAWFLGGQLGLKLFKWMQA
jgi:hypothetical protein